MDRGGVMNVDFTYLVVGGIIAVLLVGMMMIASWFRKAGPNEALIVYGFRGNRTIIGRGTVILPVVESYRTLSLELMSFDVAPQQDLYTNQGVAVAGEGGCRGKGEAQSPSLPARAPRHPANKTPQRQEPCRAGV